MQIDASTLDAAATYKLLTGCVVPRPIAWVSTRGPKGQANLAPFSTFTFVSTDPPMLGFNVGLREGQQKDTSRNIIELGEYVVNIADESLLEALHLSAADHPPDVSEADLLGLETIPGTMVAAPRLTAAPVSMECRLDQVLHFGRSGHSFIVGEVVLFHIRDDLYRNGKIDTRELNPVCRLGGPNYASLGTIVTMQGGQGG